MKKVVLVLSVLAVVALTATSCSKEKLMDMAEEQLEEMLEEDGE